MRAWLAGLAFLCFLSGAVLAKQVPQSIWELVDSGQLEKAEQRLTAELDSLEGAERAPFLLTLGLVLNRQGRTEEALVLYRQVSAQSVDPEVAGAALLRIGYLYLDSGNLRDAEQTFLSIVSSKEQTVAAIRAREGLASLFMDSGQLEQASSWLDQAGELWEKRGDKKALAEVLLDKSMLLIRQKDLVKAQQAAERSVALNRTVEGLCGLGQALHFNLELDQAIPIYYEALELAEERYGKTGEWSRIIRTGLGMALTGRRDYAEALDVYLAIPDEHYPGRPFYLSSLYEELGRPADAVAQARMALDRLSSLPRGSEPGLRSILIRGLLSLDRLDEAEKELVLLEQASPAELASEVVHLRSRLYRLKGLYSEARRLLESVDPPSDTTDQAGLAEDWALIHLGEERYEEAKPWLEKALLLRGEEAVATWVLLRLAEVEFAAGHPEEATEFVGRAVLQVSKRHGGRHLLTASTLYEAADIYSALGEGEQVTTLLRQSLDIYREKLGENSFKALLVETKLGLHQVSVGRPTGRLTLQNSLEKAESLPPGQRDEIEAISCLGLASLAKDAPEAIMWLDRGLEHAQGPYKTVYLISLAGTLIRQGKMDKARVYAQELLTQRALPVFKSMAHLVLAESYSDQPDKARMHYESALALDSTSISSLLVRANLATTYLDDERPDLALPLLREALVQERQYSTTSRETGNVSSLTVEALLTLNQMEEALTVADSSLARSLTKLITKQTAGDLAGIPSEVKRRLDEIERHMVEIESELRSSDPLQMGRRQRQAQLAAKREQLTIEKDELLLELSEKYPRYSELLHPTPIEVTAVQSVLHDDEVALLYFLGLRSFVFIVTKDKLSFTELRTSAKDINSLAETYSRSIGSGRFTRAKLLAVLEKGSPENLEQTHDALAEALLAPLKNYMDQIEDRSFVIVPTQNLWTIPFESLSGIQGERFLVQERSISYVPSLSLLVRFRQLKRKSSGSKSPPLVLGGANYGDRADPLPYAEKEAGVVAGRWTDASLYTGGQATESAYLDNPGRSTASLIHFATHGVLGESPALLLTASDGRDGRLEMSEILSQPIEADLVTLSACSTGRGWVRPGEGVVGLSRAFMHAGASSVIVSLWNVNDRSTARLMELFYEGLEKLGPSDALRQAQLKMIEEKATLNQWAPFVVVGAP
jgi:CHAT domain-containing protein